jgi:hypothetical protein
MATRAQVLDVAKQLATVGAQFVPGGPQALALGEKVIDIVEGLLDGSDEPQLTDGERAELRAATSSKAQATADRLEG